MSKTSEPWPGGVIYGWWKTCIAAENGAARKARAELKRAASPAEVLAHKVVHDLNTQLRNADDRWNLRNNPERLALIAATLAAVETSDRLSLPRKLGKNGNERPALSELRFQRILRAGDDWTLAIRLRRALPAADKQCNVEKLGNDLFWWGDDARNRWCFDYFDPRQLKDAATETLESEDA